MPYPNFPNKYNGSPVLTASNMIAYRRQVRRFPTIPAPDGVIICLETSLPKKVERQHPTSKVGRTVGDILLLKKTRGKVGVVVHLGFGAPVVAGLTEELIAWGAKNIVLISLCGGIAPDLVEGQIVVCDKAIRDEGTSYHYVPAEKYALPDQALTAKLASFLDSRQVPYRSGTSWTIDATFRETREEVNAYQAEGVLTIEMETAAFFTVCRVHQIPAAAIYVVGDSLARQPWRPPSDFKKMDQSLALAYSAAIETLQNI